MSVYLVFHRCTGSRFVAKTLPPRSSLPEGTATGTAVWSFSIRLCTRPFVSKHLCIWLPCADGCRACTSQTDVFLSTFFFFLTMGGNTNALSSNCDFKCIPGNECLPERCPKSDGKNSTCSDLPQDCIRDLQSYILDHVCSS